MQVYRRRFPEYFFLPVMYMGQIDAAVKDL